MSAATPRGTMDFGTAMLRLSAPWVVIVVALLVIAFVLMVRGRFDDVPEYMKWLSPLIVPTLGLVINALFASRRPDRVSRRVDVALYRYALGASWLYVIALFMLHYAAPSVNARQGLSVMEWLSSTTEYMVFAQAVMIGLVGNFLGFGSDLAPSPPAPQSPADTQPPSAGGAA